MKKLFCLAFLVGAGVFLILSSAKGVGQDPKLHVDLYAFPGGAQVTEQAPMPGYLAVRLAGFKSRNNLRVWARWISDPRKDLFPCGVPQVIHDVGDGEYDVFLYRDMMCRASAPPGKYWLEFGVEILGPENRKWTGKYPDIRILKSERKVLFSLEKIGFAGGQEIAPRHWALKWPSDSVDISVRYNLETPLPAGTTASLTEKVQVTKSLMTRDPIVIRDGPLFVPAGKRVPFQTNYPILFSSPGRYDIDLTIVLEGKKICEERLALDVWTAEPKIEGQIDLFPEKYKTRENLSGKAEITLSNLPNTVVSIFPFKTDVYFRGTLTPIDSETVLGRVEGKVADKGNGTFSFDLETYLPLELRREGSFRFHLEGRYAGDSVDKWTKIASALLTVEKSVKRITLRPPMALKPAAPSEKTPVTFQLRYKVEGIPDGEKADIREEVILKGTGQPPEGRKFSKRWDIEHQDGTREVDSDLNWPPLPKGKYTIEYAIDWPGVDNQTGTYEFEVISGVNYCLVAVQDDPMKGTGQAIGGGKKFNSVTRSGASIERIMNGETVETNTVSISGRPPDILFPGQSFDMTVSVSATAKSGWPWEISSGITGEGIEVESAKRKAEANSDNKKTSDSVTFRCSVTEKSLAGARGGQLSLTIFIGGGYSPAAYYYQECSPGGAGPPEKIPPEKIEPPKPAPQIKARLVYDTIELVPGEVSKVCGLYIKDWKINTEDRVYIKVPTQDAWGSLAVNRNLVVFSGDWSLAPEHMDGEEHYVSLFWSARSTALPGEFAVPIRVSQAGAGKPVDLILNIRILPRKTGAAPPGGDATVGSVAPVTTGASELGLSARLDCATLTLARGEVSTPCTIFIQGWRGDTDDPVEVVFPWADPSGSLPGGIVVFPGTSRLNPFLMFTPGVTENQDYGCIQYFRAKEDAPAGTSSIPVLVRQKGKGSVLLFLNVAVPPKFLK